jgi:hypothetical protein
LFWTFKFFGSFNGLVNHSLKNPNARIEWSDMMREPHWCEHPILYFESIGHAGLMFEFVALRDIQEGEEILINYGQEWQDAWDAHVAKWTPPKYSELYDTCVRAQQ